MNIIIIGAGAIGSLYGAKLSLHNDVTLIARKKHASKINKSGLRISGIENKVYRLKAAAGLGSINKNTLIVLATKVYDSEKSIRKIKRLVRKDTIILCLQNGLYSENTVKKIIGKKCLVLRAVTNFAAAFLEPGIVQYNGYSYTAMEKSPKSAEIAENFSRCGLNGYVSADIKHEMWKKLVFNCVLNPLTAILRIKNRQICNGNLDPLKKMIVDECLRVAEKDGVKFSLDFVQIINKEFKSSNNISSMQQDIIKGKKTEIDFLNGAVVRLGIKYGISCPVNEGLVKIIKAMEGENLGFRRK